MKNRFPWMLLIAMMPCSVLAKGVPPAYQKLAEAGPDFVIQGEYVGEIETEEGKGRWGAQIRAEGNGRFRGLGYNGGLPGAGWDGSDMVSAVGVTSNGVTSWSTDEGYAGVIKDNELLVLDLEERVIGRLKKVFRKSPTLGARPPEGGMVFFDGTSSKHFKPSIRNTPKHGLVTDDGLLREGFDSVRTFQNFSIHFEFRVPFVPTAKHNRGNSGFYAQGRYEVQVYDSFGVPANSGGCGGIYGIRKPSVNMSFPPLSWQTYDIDFTAADFDAEGTKTQHARMTVKHNGVLVQDNVEVPKATRSFIVDEGPEPGPLHFQNHDSPVRFRNIWVVEKK